MISVQILRTVVLIIFSKHSKGIKWESVLMWIAEIDQVGLVLGVDMGAVYMYQRKRIIAWS